MSIYVVSVDLEANAEQRDLFTDYLKDEDAKYWHHISFTWIVVDEQDALSCVKIRERLLELMPGVANIVMKVKSLDYASYSNKLGHDWISTNL